MGARRWRRCVRPSFCMALSSKGQSASWNAQQKNVVRIFDIFAEQDDELSARKYNWHVLPEEILCEPGLGWPNASCWASFHSCGDCESCGIPVPA